MILLYLLIYFQCELFYVINFFQYFHINPLLPSVMYMARLAKIPEERRKEQFGQ